MSSVEPKIQKKPVSQQQFTISRLSLLESQHLHLCQPAIALPITSSIIAHFESNNMKKVLGFSLLEVMVAVVIIAILASMAIPSYLYKIVREQIESTMPLTEIAKTPIAIAWKTEQIMPADNAAAGIPVPDKIVSNLVKSVAVENGAIHITFGNRANGALKGKILSLRPAVIEDAPVVPVTWVCAEAEAPEKMVIKGSNRTTVEKQYLPPMCRARANK